MAMLSVFGHNLTTQTVDAIMAEMDKNKKVAMI